QHQCHTTPYPRGRWTGWEEGRSGTAGGTRGGYERWPRGPFRRRGSSVLDVRGSRANGRRTVLRRPRRRNVPMIDAHAHLVPPDLPARIAADGVRLGARLESDGRVAFASGETSRPLLPSLLDPPRPPGCDVQIVSPWVDLLGYGLDAEQGAGSARLLNAATAGRMALATVPLQD